ncbi:LapA family protein [Microbacterium marmarense]|uniref:LapA family protein n=1 Tax=Microbacterium marmarense TaxID=3122051 RepID=A0ABU8LRE1_9MICO
MSADDRSSATDANQASKSSNTKALIAIIIAILALAFVFSNVAPATLHFLFLEFTMPAWGWFLAVLLAGVIVGSLFPWFRPRRK